jgi:hypothetical protein
MIRGKFEAGLCMGEVAGDTLVTQKSTRSGSLFRSVGHHVGSPEDRCLKLLLSKVVSNSRPRGDVSQDRQLVCLAL